MTIEIVDFPIENGDFHSYVAVYQRVASGKRLQFANLKPWPSRNSWNLSSYIAW